MILFYWIEFDKFEELLRKKSKICCYFLDIKIEILFSLFKHFILWIIDKCLALEHVLIPYLVSFACDTLKYLVKSVNFRDQFVNSPDFGNFSRVRIVESDFKHKLVHVSIFRLLKGMASDVKIERLTRLCLRLRLFHTNK